MNKRQYNTTETETVVKNIFDKEDEKMILEIIQPCFQQAALKGKQEKFISTD